MGNDEDAQVRHEADADDQPATGRSGVAVVVVETEPGQRRELDERPAAIEQHGDTVARHHLASLFETNPAALRIRPHLCFRRAKLSDQCQHALAVCDVVFRLGINMALQNAHLTPPDPEGRHNSGRLVRVGLAPKWQLTLGLVHTRYMQFKTRLTCHER